MNNQNSDQELVNFLQQYRPTLPEAAPDLELKILAAIDRNEQAGKKQNYWGKVHSIVSNNRLIIPSFRQWAFPPTIVAMLIVFWSGYRLLVPGELNPNEVAHLEAFLVNNWEEVLHDSRENMSDSSKTDWLNFPVSADSEQPTNN
ncbi:MAG: hypothetical protein QQW96_07985 [Tychonema bourrellyi B0820]|uniref:DUF3619 domain-containing protein n=1 Tax=Tychonema bourrellyi FEM_GT703 TaxID=2040638 RepID=A0A2G4F1Z6_9CYAN|nr:hypothetical protein [Tychonema bourrellyi]MDQ2097570.1 hypothetical protein [Tychonema bourrellyi B0820]PHX55497.1 hypothetical protein CP500_010340 [Tychonema bourrellyi FEM_GT703]